MEPVSCVLIGQFIHCDVGVLIISEAGGELERKIAGSLRLDIFQRLFMGLHWDNLKYNVVSLLHSYPAPQSLTSGFRNVS